MGINLVTVVSGGTGYAVNDEILISGGTFTTQARYRITAVSAGVVTTLTPITTPNYQALPTNPASTTTAIGTGSGLTLTVNWAVTGQSFTAGSGYIEQPTVTFSASGGSGAAAYATVGSSVRLQSLGTTSEVAFAFRGASGINSPTAPDILRILDVAAANDTGIFIQNSGFGRAQIQAYGNANANLFLCANGAGRVTFTTSGTSLVEQMRVAHTASAVNYVQVTGATTSNIPTISGQGSDTNVSMAYTTKGFSSTHRFQLGSAEALRIEQFGSTAVVNRFSMFANVSGGAPMLVTRGTDTNVGFELSTQGTGGYRFYTNTASNGTGVIQFAITHTASAVNYVQTTGGIAGQGVTIIPAGSDANILLALNSKGTNPIQCYTGGLRQFQVSDTASAVNFIQVTGSATATQPVISAQGSDTSVGLRLQWKGQANMFFVSGAGAYTQFRILGANNAVNNIAVTGTIAGSAPFISAEGSDTNIDLALTPKGTGRVKYGTHTANADAPITGYIEIVDSGGTIRKLAVIT
jgi:Tfp pilus assembly protein PilV